MFDTVKVVTTEGIPEGLDEMEPGPILGLFLSSIEMDALSGHDRVVMLRAHQRMMSHYQALLYEDMVSINQHLEQTDGDIELAWGAAAAEIRCALSLTRRTADTELDYAWALKQRLPVVWDALAAGDLDGHRAKTIVRGTDHLPEETARRVADELIGEASELTTGQIAARLRRLCIDVDPDQANTRYQQAIADRRIVLTATDAGTATLAGHELPPDRASAAANRINQLARHLKTATEPRTMDQLRADVFLDLLCGDDTGQPGGKKAVVDLRVDLATLAGLADRPGELGGYGPVIADIARQIAENQTDQRWHYTITNPKTGQPVDHGTTRRRPTARQRRAVLATHNTCTFKGCRAPATSADLDHTVAYAHGGPTTVANLAPLCETDHTLRHKHGWTYHQQPDGTHLWTSKLGHKYTTRPPP